jgi:vacuolar iron transporter family protein
MEQRLATESLDRASSIELPFERNAMTSQKDVHRYRTHLQDEVDSAAQYRAMASNESDANLAKIYARLAEVEEKHAGFWEQKLRDASCAVGRRRPSFRARILISLAKRFGARTILSTVAATERAERNVYVDLPETDGTRMTSDEHAHARMLRAIEQTHSGGVRGGVLAKLEGRHRAVGGNALRAAVLGANDGLCSNLSLVMGVAGATSNEHTLLVTGLAGLLAGAFSMALGEWVSVTSSRELAEREIRIERAELEQDPQAEAEELELIYQAKGFSEKESKALSKHVIADPDRALEALSREELNIDPEELGGSAWSAALTSFVLFSTGAAIPVLPYLVFSGTAAPIASILAGALALFSAGGAIAVFTGRSLLFSGMRQLVLGLLAAGVTFGIGRLLGVAIGG